MKIIAVTNRKGGVGKSTMASHIAAGMATLGYNVALVDTDSQGHAALMLGMPHEDGLYHAMIEKVPLNQVVRPVPPERYSNEDQPSQGNLYLLPSAERTYRVPFELGQDETFLFLDMMEALAQDLSLHAVIIDTNPTLSMFDGAVYLATDGFVYVTECEALSLDGVQDAIAQMQRFAQQRIKYLGRETRVLGIIPNKMRPRTMVHRHNISALARQFPNLVWPPVTLRVGWVECSNLGEMVYNYAPTGQEARDAWEITRRTMQELESWEAEKTD